MPPPCLRLFLLFLIAEQVSKKASRLEKYKKPVFRLFCKLVLEKHSNIQNRPFLKTGFLSALQKSAKETKISFLLFFRRGKRKALTHFFFAKIFALQADPNLKGYLVGLKYM
ncbi:MAG: hypothetical protein IJ016_06015 [Elusimicrobiaceae bacterium]|nr:hypothetical protein [Elusimicrobiaceae bacterium]